MTPQQKASDLLHKFTHAEGCSRILTKDAAKGCAMICVEECRLEAYKQGNLLAVDREDFWYETIKEIEKL